MAHFIEQCRICKKVTRQCRCGSPAKEQRWTVCNSCQRAGHPFCTSPPPVLKIQPWYCEVCGQVSFTKFQPGEDVMSVVHLIEDSHKKVSPNCTNSAMRIKVGQPGE